ncbi:Alpha/Beta hydrolase protein [Morchella snyderi]|nr:Alpha/Beta hydrolase protein [Morchella snyderi]
MARPRWTLHAEALFWRTLMDAGMRLHRLAPPAPPAPSFTLTIPSTLSATPGAIPIVVYTPATYAARTPAHRYPLLINFHGGGFTLGRATDDSRWAAAVTAQVGAVVASVDYRLAPEHPFPTPVDDGADAILYLLSHAAELAVDPDNVGVSGFSAGGNMAFTTLLRYEAALALAQGGGGGVQQRRCGRVRVVAAWYPSTDFTASRDLRRGTNTRPDKELPRLFTRLFDACYLYPPGGVALDDPLLSPGVARAEVLAGALPGEVLLWTCEWDELAAEGERFRARLREVGKRVGGRVVRGTAHAWDKSPTPVAGDAVREEVYKEACGELRRVFGLQRPEPPPARPLNILLTNGRFPTTIDLARQLHLARHTVTVVDPMHYHVCRFSRSVRKSIHVPAPHVDPAGYIAAVAAAVASEHIDLIIPMHEETFHLAACRDPAILQRLFAPPFETLIALHSKWEFTRLLARAALPAPDTWLCRSRADVEALDRTRELALKPVFGRACAGVHRLQPGEPLPALLDVREDSHCVAQEWLAGRRYCSYAVVRGGRLRAFAVYPVEDTIDGSSAVSFVSVEHAGARAYVEALVRVLGRIDGQIALDLVDVEGRGVVAIECNPRATSGIHLFSRTGELADAIVGDGDGVWEARPGARRQLMPGMLMWDRSGGYVAHMKRLVGSKDVLFSTRDLMPSLMQPFLLTSYYKICQERRMKLPEMFQWDLTWEPEGEELGRVRERVDGFVERGMQPVASVGA